MTKADHDTLSIGDYFDFLSGGTWRQPTFTKWPPDVFALAASVLDRTGAYTAVVEAWPSSNRKAGSWIRDIRRAGSKWRLAFGGASCPPHAVSSRWQIVRKASKGRLARANEDERLRCALIELVALADEASVNIGLPGAGKTQICAEGRRLLALGRSTVSLCRNVDPSKLQVLPKLHTPQTGITLRSLTHNLALCRTRGVKPLWHLAPGILPEGSRTLNLLVVPWPPTIEAPAFAAVPKRRNQLKTMTKGFRFFEYTPPDAPGVVSVVRSALRRLKTKGRHVHGVVLPELALRRDDHERLLKAVLGEGAFLICGVLEKGGTGAKSRNLLRFDALLGGGMPLTVSQTKHHRWKLDDTQLRQYRLQRRLGTGVRWWEHSAIEERSINFFVMHPGLTICVLVCEDLARQEPAAEIVRAVGPNLLIALLLDGPQLPSRWSARYATVFADDPGSTVVTVTSQGMARRSIPPRGIRRRSRVVSLCKEGANGTLTELECPPGKTGIYLSFAIKNQEEWTADGRGDGGISSFPVLRKHECI